jgi:hypothetical protein
MERFKTMEMLGRRGYSKGEVLELANATFISLVALLSLLG